MDYINRITFAILASVTYFGSFNISAQEVVEEVVVTATRREESLQDVALSVQALSDADLEAQQVTEMYDLGDLTPGISFAPTIGSGYFIGIRGSATEAIGATSVGSVQAAINGHVLNSSAFGDLGFLDPARIEILSGPQGTLYGRNVTGGLINVISARPTGDNSGYAKMQYGNLGQTRLSSALNVPVSDNVNARFAYSSYVQDGTVENLHLGTEIDDRDARAARLSLDVDLGDSVLQFTHEVHDFEDTRLNWANQFCSKDLFLGCDPLVRGTYNTGAHSAGTLAATFGTLTFMQPDKLVDTFAGAPSADSLNETYQDVDPARSQTTSHSTVEWIQGREDGDLKVKLTYGTNDYRHTDDNDKQVSVVGFQTLVGELYGGVGPFAPFEVEFGFDCFPTQVYSSAQTVECSTTEEERTQFEVNWISDLDGPINYTLGAYYHNRGYMNDYQVQTEGYAMNASFDRHPYSDMLFGGLLDGFGGVSFWQNLGGALQDGLPLVLGEVITVEQLVASVTSALIAADAAGQLLAPDSDGNTDAAFGPGYMRFSHPEELRGLINSDHGTQKSQSLFGEFYYQLDDVTKLTLGLRYDENDTETSSINTLADAAQPGALAGLCARANGGEFLRAGTECGIKYGSLVEDAITGKIAIQRDISDDLMVYALYSTGNKPGGTSPNETGAVLAYAGTDSTNLELGLRSVLAGGRVLLNATLFQADAKDAHNSMIYGTSAITNTLDYTHTGLEVQSRFLLGENTSLDFNLFALDSEIGNESFYDPINPFGITGARLGFADDEESLSGLFQAVGAPAALADAAALGIADAIGALFPFCNFGLYAQGIMGKCQGVFVVNPDIQDITGMAPVVRQDISGNRMPATRELDYNIALNQSASTKNGSLDMRLTYAYKGDMYIDLFNTERANVPERTVFDFIATYTPNQGDWYAGFYAKNIADKRHILSFDRGSEVQGGVLNATVASPRTYGVSFGINF